MIDPSRAQIRRKDDPGTWYIAKVEKMMVLTRSLSRESFDMQYYKMGKNMGCRPIAKYVEIVTKLKLIIL